MKNIVAVILCIVIPLAAVAADKQPSYKVTYGSGSLTEVKAAFDAENILENLLIDRDAIKGDSAETDKLMDSFKSDKENLVAATNLMDVISNVLERTAYEGWLLEMYNHITNDRAREDAEKLIREHYADLAKMTAFSVESVHLVARGCKSKELCALAVKVERDIQRIADRYHTLSKK